MKTDLIILGSIIHEKIITPFAKRGKITIGGSAAYAALSASYFARTGVVSAVGSDFIDLQFLFLKNKNINTSSITKLNGNTLFWEAEYNKQGEIVRQKVDLGVYKKYKPKLSAADKQAKTLFIESTNPKFGLEVLKQFNKPIIIALDTRGYYITNFFSNLNKLLQKTDLLFLNKSELKLVLKKLKKKNFNPIYLFNKYPKLKVLFLKKGANGVTIFTKDTKCSLRAFPIKKVIDTTGAGDSFAGAVLGKITNAKEINLDINNIIECAKIGVVMASFAIEKGGFQGLHTIKHSIIKKRLNVLSGSTKKIKIQKTNQKPLIIKPV